MRFFLGSTSLATFALLAELGRTIRTVPNSPCANKCGDIAKTTSQDVVCSDADYSTPTGQRFAECISCQLSSNATDFRTGDSDLKWLLYNLRFAMSTCLWGYPDDTFVQNTPCITSRACGSFETNVVYEQLNPNASTYAYCTGISGQDERGRCSDCLRQMGSNHFLSNFFTTVAASCDNPSNNLISLDGSLFGTAYVNVINSQLGPQVYAPSEDGPIDLGTKIGIAVGAIVVLLLAVGIIIVYCGKRRTRKILEERKRQNNALWTQNVGGNVPAMERIERVCAGPRLDTKWAIGASTIDESPISACEEGFSPYHSQYTSPVSARAVSSGAPFEWPLKSPGATTITPIEEKKTWEGDEEYELGKVRPRNRQEQGEYDRQLAEEWAREVASRGFTVASPEPSVRKTESTRYFPAPPTKAKR